MSRKCAATKATWLLLWLLSEQLSHTPAARRDQKVAPERTLALCLRPISLPFFPSQSTVTTRERPSSGSAKFSQKRSPTNPLGLVSSERHLSPSSSSRSSPSEANGRQLGPMLRCFFQGNGAAGRQTCSAACCPSAALRDANELAKLARLATGLAVTLWAACTVWPSTRAAALNTGEPKDGPPEASSSVPIGGRLARAPFCLVN